MSGKSQGILKWMISGNPVLMSVPICRVLIVSIRKMAGFAQILKSP